MKPRQTGARTVQQVLEQSSALTQLTARLQLSRQCLRAVTPLIPLPMRQAVHSGPVEHTPAPKQPDLPPQAYWVLLADNAAIAAKLRQLQPLMLQYLEKAGIHIHNIHIQVMPPTAY